MAYVGEDIDCSKLPRRSGFKLYRIRALSCKFPPPFSNGEWTGWLLLLSLSPLHKIGITFSLQGWCEDHIKAIHAVINPLKTQPLCTEMVPSAIVSWILIMTLINISMPLFQQDYLSCIFALLPFQLNLVLWKACFSSSYVRILSDAIWWCGLWSVNISSMINVPHLYSAVSPFVVSAAMD